jgi:hypothetical protein
MFFTALLITLLQILVITLLIVWWVRWSRRGLEWVTVWLFMAIGISYLSSYLFRVPPHQVSCDGLCAGWRGFPFHTHFVGMADEVFFQPVSFVRNVLFYYVVILSFTAVIIWLGQWFRWQRRPWWARILFILVVIVMPLATMPWWVSPPQPQVSGPEQRLAINAARDWRWQLRLDSFMHRRLALEDVRPMPDDEHQRVCFRVYTWFYLPYAHAYVNLEPEGVRAIDGANIPLAQSCWEQ